MIRTTILSLKELVTGHLGMKDLSGPVGVVDAIGDTYEQSKSCLLYTSYAGIISGVTGWGLYVELPNTVEGLIHINTLRDDYYVFDQDAYELRGDMTGKIFRLGQKVRVRVADADKMLKTVDFVLAEED